MAKLISKKNKKNAAIVARTLESLHLDIQDGALRKTNMKASEALMLADQYATTGSKFVLGLSIADQLLKHVPNIVDPWIIKLKCLVGLERLTDANGIVDYLLRHGSDNSGVLFHCSEFYLILGEIDKATALLRKAIILEPDKISIYVQLARCYSQSGRAETAIKLYKKILTRFGVNKSLSVLVSLGRLQDLDEKHYQVLVKAFSDENRDKMSRFSIGDALAHHAKRDNDIELEMEYLIKSNKLMKESLGESGSGFNREVVQTLSEEQFRTFSSAKVRWLEGYKPLVTSKMPIFIIAMPRSGTTLMEQMLGSHSIVGQAGESQALFSAVSSAYNKTAIPGNVDAYPQFIEMFDKTLLDGIAQQYYDHQAILTGHDIYVEKNLGTYRFVGLAGQLFPAAKFIHMDRHPLDIFLSCYRGGIPGVPSTCDPADMAYDFIEMKKLIAHWKEIYPDRVRYVNYQELVESPEDVMRGVIDFLGLDWEDSILQFHKRKNVVRTLSAQQVRKGIYTSSVKKWKPFQKMLQPAIDVLLEEGYLTEDDL